MGQHAPPSDEGSIQRRATTHSSLWKPSADLNISRSSKNQTIGIITSGDRLVLHEVNGPTAVISQILSCVGVRAVMQAAVRRDPKLPRDANAGLNLAIQSLLDFTAVSIIGWAQLIVANSCKAESSMSAATVELMATKCKYGVEVTCHNSPI